MFSTTVELDGDGFNSVLVVPLGFIAHNADWWRTVETIDIPPLTHLELDSRRNVLCPCRRCHDEQLGLAG